MVDLNYSTEKFNRYYQVFSVENISQAPNATGLYAWYAGLGAGSKDWEFDIVNGVDAGTERLRKLLQQHTNSYCFRELEATALGTFSQTWSGQLQDQTAKSFQDILAQPNISQEQVNYDQQRAPKLRSTLESENNRQLMVKALEAANPILSSPIYVGISDCLNNRLMKHVHEIKKLNALIIRTPSERNNLQKTNTSNFAVRVVAAGFPPEELQVWTFNLDLLAEDLECNSQENRTVSEAVEWVLNRWHRPYLGRR